MIFVAISLAATVSYLVRRPSRLTQRAVFRTPPAVCHVLSAPATTILSPQQSLMHTRCIHMDVVRVGSGPLLADAHPQYARRRERNTKQAETAPSAANPSTQHTQPARVTKIEFRVSQKACWRSAEKKLGGEGLAGWVSLMARDDGGQHRRTINKDYKVTFADISIAINLSRNH